MSRFCSVGKSWAFRPSRESLPPFSASAESGGSKELGFCQSQHLTALSSATAAVRTSVTPSIRRDLKLFKRARCETVNKQSSPLFCPSAWERANFTLTGTCRTEESFFLCWCRACFWVASPNSALDSRWSSGLCSLVFPGVSDLQAWLTGALQNAERSSQRNSSSSRHLQRKFLIGLDS